MKNWLRSVWQGNTSFIIFLVLMFVFRSAIADWNTVPTGSMKPTILEGDRILVNKLAYDLRLPFTLISLIKLADPQRGDIIVFDSKVSDKRLVKRVIGEPGDVVALHQNRLMINGVPLAYDDVGQPSEVRYQKEHLLGEAHRIRIDQVSSALSNFNPVKVPEGHYLVLGDNRDNSADSRVIGFVPRGEVVGRTSSVVLSFNYDNYYLPRADRFFHTL